MPPHPPRQSFTLAQTSPLGDPFPDPTAIISCRGIALGFLKLQCRRFSPSLTLSHHHYFLATPRLTTAPRSGTLTLWRHNCTASWRKMRRQGEAWQRLWILEFHLSLRYCPSQWTCIYDPSAILQTLVQIMAWRRPGDKPLSEPMVVKIIDAYMRNSVSMS